MKIFLSFLWISFFLSITTSCIESRKNKLLVIYEEDGPYSALKTEWIRIIKESNFDFEVVDFRASKVRRFVVAK